jgi:hypothetical protein
MTMAVDVRRLDARTAAETHALEMAARQAEASALSAALRVVARGIEAFALDQRGDMRQVQWSERLRGMADQVDRRWESVG